jgi:hypothetical protein
MVWGSPYEMEAGKERTKRERELEKTDKANRAYDKKHGTRRYAEGQQREADQFEAHKKAVRAEQNTKPPVTQHSPTKVNVPGWRVIVLGGSGGLKGRIRAE